MTVVVPLAQAALRLGIDAKTLRRWLANAQLPLHPVDQNARTKGVSIEHLHRLANLHQRHLTPTPLEPCAQEAPSAIPLPAALLALPETVLALQQQITALQQQIADHPLAPTVACFPYDHPTLPQISSRCKKGPEQTGACHCSCGVPSRWALRGHLSEEGAAST